MSIYHEGSRELQDRFDSRRIADRLDEVNVSSTFSDDQRELIDAAPMFWLATADDDGWPDVSLSYKGTASLHDDNPMLAEWEGAQLVVRVAAERIFLNCPRYLHRMELAEYSKYAPRAGHTPPVPDWKLRPEYREHLPARDLAALDDGSP
jgi:uncharacterized protein